MKIFQNFFKNNQKLNANEIAVEISNNKFQRLDKFLNSKIVYDHVLSTSESSVSIPCNLLQDGGIYEFIFIIQPTNVSSPSDYKMYFNDNNTLQYAENMI